MIPLFIEQLILGTAIVLTIATLIVVIICFYIPVHKVRSKILSHADKNKIDLKLSFLDYLKIMIGK